MKQIGDTVYTIIDGKIHVLKIEAIDARHEINPAYYASNRHEARWLRDSECFDSTEELIDNLKSCIVR